MAGTYIGGLKLDLIQYFINCKQDMERIDCRTLIHRASNFYGFVER